MESQVPHVHINSLLALLKPSHPELPLDARTLLSTPQHIRLQVMAPGHYFYFGLSYCLKRALDSSRFFRMRQDHVDLLIGLDGTPTAKSSCEEFWPIVGQLKGVGNGRTFVIGIYWGPSKPLQSNDLLKEFVLECNAIKRNGLNHRGVNIKVNLIGITCDAPARAYCKYCKGHTGYSSCGRCTVKGQYDNSVVFIDIRGPRRTNASFRARDDEEHHIGRSVLEDLIGFDMVKNFPLGVVRKFMNSLTIGTYYQVKLDFRQVKEISSRLETISANLPREYQRKPRSLRELARYKAQ